MLGKTRFIKPQNEHSKTKHYKTKKNMHIANKNEMCTKHSLNLLKENCKCIVDTDTISIQFNRNKIQKWKRKREKLQQND